MSQRRRSTLPLRIVATCVCLTAVAGLDNGLAKTPPMGWLSWERFRCNVDCAHDSHNCISEDLIRNMSARLVEDGYSALGYDTVGIDDCWLAKSRDKEGRLQPDPNRFPSGMKNLGDYIHKRKLKYGIYGDIGSKTCGGYPGMQANFAKDAETYADWGIDYLKVDGCYEDPDKYADLYPNLGAALNATGRPIVYSCSWPAYLPDPVVTGYQVPYEDLRENCNLWRNWVDIQDSWESLKGIVIFWAEASQLSKGFQETAGPGAWNDPDMLIIGNKGLNEAQSELQMGLWSMFSAPLLMSNDLRDIPSWAKQILQNQRAIAINQDPLGVQAELYRCLEQCKALQLWYKPLASGDTALAFVNLLDDVWNDRVCFDLERLDISAASALQLEIQAEEVFQSTKENGAEAEVERRGAATLFCVPYLQATSIRLYTIAWHRHEKAQPYVHHQEDPEPIELVS